LFCDEVTEFVEKKYFAEYEHIKRSLVLLNMNMPKNDFIILDIGGSTGKTSTMYSEAFPKNKVYVFEPIRESFLTLSANIKDRKNIIAVNKAVGNQNGSMTINIAKRISSSSLLELHADKNSGLFAETLESAGTELIEICRLDDFLSKDSSIGIMKIDVQGYELEVLKGANLTLKDTYVVLVEVNNHEGYKGSPKYNEIDQALRDAGFMLFDICPSTREKNQLKEWDVIYVNNKFYGDRIN
jgi:FkbM family methyltransferase